MPNFVMLVGLPGSGKSSLRELLIRKDGLYPNAEVLSTDDIVQSIADEQGVTYNDVFQDAIQEATKRINIRMQELAQAGTTDLILDQTNLTRKSRFNKLQPFMRANWSRHAYVVCDPGEDELNLRLASRPGKNIPEEAISRMRSQFQEPNRDEGFDTVSYIGQYMLSSWMNELE